MAGASRNPRGREWPRAAQAKFAPTIVLRSREPDAARELLGRAGVDKYELVTSTAPGDLVAAVENHRFEPVVSVVRFEYITLGLSFVGVLVLVYRLGAGLHGLGHPAGGAGAGVDVERGFGGSGGEWH